MAASQEDDMYLFQSGLDQTPNAFAGQDFDDFLAGPSEQNNEETADGGFMNPNDLSIKRERTDANSGLGKISRSSRSSASSSSSSASSKFLKRNVSTANSTDSPSKLQNSQSWNSGINGLSMPAAEQYYDDTAMSGLDSDLEASNQQMASAFDFDTAASTPSGFDTASITTMRPNPTIHPFRRSVTMTNFTNLKNTPARMSSGQAQFFLGSREASPLNAMLPSTASQSPWAKNSPSSGLEETFNHITMNGDSPGNATLSPNMQFNANGFTFDADLSGTPSSFNKDMTSPPSTIHSGDGSPHLTIHPTSLKSRVETQIPIKMVLYPLPQGARKLRLPTHTVSKPKFLAKPEVDKSSEILELSTSLVCTSAMQDPLRRDRALARARGDDLSSYTRPSPASSSGSHTSSKDDDEKPLNGGEVRICSGCIQRERKRASRKKQKKPEEEELFQKDEEKRVVVFNTSEIKDWVEVTKDSQPSGEYAPPPSPAGAVQVELPMRIACYCRHQNEKMGFQVIFTIKDWRDKVVAQAMTNSIMITDDHKTHTAPPPVQSNSMSQIPSAPQLPGAGVFSTSGMDMAHTQPNGAKLFKQSFSTTDLQSLQHNFNPNFPMSTAANPFAVPNTMSAMTSGTMTPRNLSRPASPSGPVGPTTKRRKQSGSGKLPTGLTMTRLDTGHNAPGSAATVPNTAASSPFAANMPSFMSPTDRHYQVPGRPPPFSTSPPTPNGNDGNFPMNINRSFSLENIPRQAMMSAPPSRQPSRPNSPRPPSNRDSYGAADSGFGQALNNSLMGHSARRSPPIIHKLVPNEGSVTGGTEVTLLGNGFYQGLEVMFGDIEATTTTFWGEKCLNCISPPALQPGIVTVMFKHEHPQYSAMQQSSQSRHSTFTYTDDREVELLRLALRTLGRQMPHPTDDPYSAAQQLLQQNQQQNMWSQQGTYNVGTAGHQRQTSGYTHPETSGLESSMLDMLQYATRRSPKVLAEFDLRRPNGLTLLHLASSLGLSSFATALLSAGANPNQRDNSGHTPMHHAAMYGHEKVIGRLLLAGGNHRIRSFKSFVPSDFATTLASYQAILQTNSHSWLYEHGLSRKASGCANQSTPSKNCISDGSNNILRQTLATNQSQIPFEHPTPLSIPSSQAISRRNGNHLDVDRSNNTVLTQNGSPSNSDPTSDSTLLQAWRHLLHLTQLQQQHVVEQIQHLQESAQRAVPYLPNLPTISQDYPMMRRMSSLFPTRNDMIGLQPSEPAANQSPAPPAYAELFPGKQDSSNDLQLKKGSAIQAAADAAADIHFETFEQGLPKYVKNARLTTTALGLFARTSIRGFGITKDRKLSFLWIPLLAIVLALIINISGVLQTSSMVTKIVYGMPKREAVGIL